MQKSSDPRVSEPMFIRASRISLSDSLIEHPLDENITYEPFVWTKNPTLLDRLMYIPNNMMHFMRNLSKAFGWKFIFLVCMVYGLQQGLGNAWFFQARDYYFKDVAELQPAEAQANIAAAHTPWNIKPLYGMISDTLFINGLQRAPYITLAGGVGSAALTILWLIPLSVPLAVVFMFCVNFSVSSPDVMIDASIAEKCKFYPKFASDLQALCWGSMALFSVVGFGTSGIMIQYCGPRLTFGILVITAVMVFIPSLMGFLGEKKSNIMMEHLGQFDSHPSSSTSELNKWWSQFMRWSWDNYREHKKIFILAVFVSLCACSLSVVILITSNWTIRFTCVLLVASVVALSVYFVNKQDLPDVANVALFIFLREAFNPDIDTTMFYWYSDAEDGPKFSPVFIGVINMCGYLTMFAGVAIYNKYMTTWKYRYIFTLTQILVCVVGLLDIVIVSRWNKMVGYPDDFMLVGDLTLYPMVRRFVMMPIFVLASKVCPDGAEATIYAMLMALSNFGNTVGIYFGSFLVVSFGVTDTNYDNFVWVIVVKSLCRLLPILSIPFLIPDGAPQHDDDFIPDSVDEDEEETLADVEVESTGIQDNTTSLSDKLMSNSGTNDRHTGTYRRSFHDRKSVKRRTGRHSMGNVY